MTQSIMLIKKSFQKICVISLVLFPCASFAGIDSGALIDLNQLLSNMNTVQGKFEQVITDEEQEIVEENTGEFWLQRPGFFRWHVLPPFEKVMVSNQTTLWTYDPELEQVTVETVSDQLMESPMLLLSGDLAAIEAQYAVTTVGPEEETEKNTSQKSAEAEKTFQLIPRDSEAVFEKMFMHFRGEKLNSMTLHNALGEKQVYQFSEIQLNKTLAASLFEFVPQETADILNNDK